MAAETQAKLIAPKWDLAHGLDDKSQRTLNLMPKRVSSAIGRRSSHILQATSSMIKGPSPSPIPREARTTSPFPLPNPATAGHLPLPLPLLSPGRIAVSNLAGATAVPGAVGGWFNSRTKFASVPLSFSPTSEFLAAKHQRHRPVASGRFLPEPASSHHSRLLTGPPGTPTDEASHVGRNRSTGRTPTLDPLPLRRSLPGRLKVNQTLLEDVKSARKSVECLPHRIDRLYIMSGKAIKPKNRYEIDQQEIERLKTMHLNRNTQLYYGKGLCDKKTVMSKTSDQYEERLQEAVFGEDGEKMEEEEQEVDIEIKNASPPAGRSSPSPVDEDNDEDKELEEVFGQDRDIPEQKSRPDFVIKPQSTAPSSGDSKMAFVTEISQLQDVKKLVDEEQRKAFAAIFSRMARDGSRISLLDFQKMVFPNASSDESASFLSVFDLNKDGMISLEEFEAVMAINDKINGTRTTNPDQTVELNLSTLVRCVKTYKEMFQTVDDDGDGKISTGELTILLSAALGMEGGDPEFLKQVMKHIDKDESGFIEFSEFLLYTPFFIALHQRICSDPFSLDAIEDARDAVRRRWTVSNSKT
eukprot:m.51299 g.51299  ORF g.51299 m.51299 type:complete len:583 (+) comp34131_c0_seq1:122-1870(+)